MKNVGVLAIMLAGLLMIVQCAKDGPLAINASNENPGISGILYGNDGTVLKNIPVHILKKNFLADTSESSLAKRTANAFSSMTDGSGKFVFETDFEPDTYVIEARNGNNAVLIDSVRVIQKGARVNLAADTLKPMGAIKGVVQLSQGGAPQNAYVLAFGIDQFTKINADGTFLFPNLAQGAYTLRIVSGSSDYSALDTGNIVVVAAETTDVQTLMLPYRGIPVPQNLTSSYDTLRQVVTLHWNKLDGAIVNGYNVYRRNIDSNSTFRLPLNNSLISDTIFIDSIVEQDKIYEYRIAATNISKKEGVKSSGVKVTISSYFVIDTIVKMTYGTQQGQFISMDDIAVNIDDELFISDAGNKRIEIFDAGMHFNRQVGNLALGTKNISVLGDTIYAVNVDYSQNDNNSIIALSSKGLFLDSIARQAMLFDISAKNGKLFTTAQNTISMYTTDGILKNTWTYNGERYCAKVLIADSNSIFFGGESKVVKINANGEKIAEIAIPDRNKFATDIAFDSHSQTLYIACNNLEFNGSFRNCKVNGVVYAFDSNFKRVADFWLWNICGAQLSLAVQSNGSLLIVVGSEQNKIIKLKPFSR